MTTLVRIGENYDFAPWRLDVKLVYFTVEVFWQEPQPQQDSSPVGAVYSEDAVPVRLRLRLRRDRAETK
jgi:hypothetical protein